MLIQNFGVTNEEHYGTQMYVMVFSEVVNSDSLFRHCTLCYALLLAEKVLTGFSTKLRMFSNAWAGLMRLRGGLIGLLVCLHLFLLLKAITLV